MNTFRPMLACSLLPPHMEHTDSNIRWAMQQLYYPVIASPKIDGIRALRLNGTLLSRRLKLIPNKSIRERSLILPGGMDCELYCEGMPYHDIESIVMSREHVASDRISFHILDRWIPNLGYENRLTHCRMLPVRPDIRPPVTRYCSNAQELFDTFIEWEPIYEGICFRTPNSPYKSGRSTLREQYLIKLSRYERCECTIIGFEEQMENANSAESNALGLTERSSKLDMMYGKNTLGALICNAGEHGEIRVGTGFTDSVRKEIWDNKEKYLNETITIKHKPAGAKDKLRHPVFCGFRKD